MLFPGKKQKKPAQGREEKSLYPVQIGRAHV